MAELTADTTIPMQELDFISQQGVIKNGQQLYVGQYVDIVSGVLAPHTNGHTIYGIVVGPGVPGNNPLFDGFVLTTLPIPSIAPGNTASVPPPAAVVGIGQHVLENVTVIAGLTGADADVGRKVYITTGNALADMTITQPGSDAPLGEIVWWNRSTTAPAWRVQVASFEARSAA